MKWILSGPALVCDSDVCSKAYVWMKVFTPRFSWWVMQVKQGAEPQSAEANPRVSAFLTTQQIPVTRKDETHLFLKFSALALPVNEPCELFFFIYDAKQQKALR